MVNLSEINPTSDSLNIKFKRLQTLTIVLGTLLGICALAGLAIGLYFIISTNLKTASTTTTTPGKHYFNLKSKAIKSKEEMNEILT